MRNCTLNYRYTDKVFLSGLHSFCDSCCDFSGFTQAAADHAFTVANNDNGSERKGTTTFRHLDDTIDSNESIF